jgi:hypothetical protein
LTVRDAGTMVVAGQQPAVRTGKYDIRIFWIRRNPAAFAAAHVVPVAFHDRSAISAGFDFDCCVILLRAVNSIRKIVVGGHTVKLRGRLILGRPGAAAVVADIRAAIVGLHHAIAVIRCDPQIVIVAVGNWDRRKCLSRVVGAIKSGIEHIHRVWLYRVGINA